MGDPRVEFVWHEVPVPAGLPVSQVYGWLLCPVSGRVLIQEQDDGTFSLLHDLARRRSSLLRWGQPAEAQARAAAEAGRQWGLPVDHPAAAGYED